MRTLETTVYQVWHTFQSPVEAKSFLTTYDLQRDSLMTLLWPKMCKIFICRPKQKFDFGIELAIESFYPLYCLLAILNINLQRFPGKKNTAIQFKTNLKPPFIVFHCSQLFSYNLAWQFEWFAILFYLPQKRETKTNHNARGLSFSLIFRFCSIQNSQE